MDWISTILLDLKAVSLSLLIATIGTLSLKYLETKRKRKWKHPYIFLVGSFLVLYLITLVIYSVIVLSLTGNSHKEPGAKEKIQQYREQILYLRVDYETIDHRDPTYSDITEADKALLIEVKNEAPNLLEKLKVVPDDQLSPGYRILKYDLIAYVGTIAAEVETNIQVKRRLIETSKIACDEAFYRIRQTRNKAEAGDPEYSKLWNWIIDDEIQNRLHSIMAWLTAIEAGLDDQITDQERESD